MNNTIYGGPVAYAMSALNTAMQAAKNTLPDEVLRKHYIASKHSPSPWRSVEAQVRTQPDCDIDVLHTLTDLSLLSEALACLVAVAEPRVTTPPNLTLAKVKRSQ